MAVETIRWLFETYATTEVSLCSLVIENQHPPLIEREVFDAVQKKTVSRRTTGRRPRGRSAFCLSGVLHCGHCGNRLYGATRLRPNAGPYRNYVCFTHKRFVKCKSYSIPAERIESYVLEMVREQFTSQSARRALREHIAAEIQRERNPENDVTASLRKQINKLDREIETGSHNLLLAKAADVTADADLLTQWKQRRARLESDLRTALRNCGKRVQKHEMIDAAMRELDQFSCDLDPQDAPKLANIIGKILDRIELWWGTPKGRNHRLREGLITFADLSNMQLSPQESPGDDAVP